MSTFNNVLDFISLMGISIREFETRATLSHGTINAARGNGELSASNINKIVEHFSTELKEKGFIIVDLIPLGMKEKVILTRVQRDSLGTVFNISTIPLPSLNIEERLNDKERIIQEKEARRQDAEARLDKADTLNDRLLKLLESNLDKTRQIQLSTLADLKASIEYQAENEAKGNKKRKDEILTSVSKLAGEHLDRIVKVYN